MDGGEAVARGLGGGGPVLHQEGRHVGVALLRGEVQGGEARLGLGPGLGPVLEERGRDVDLVLAGGDVEGRVAVLGRGVGGGAVIEEEESHVLTKEKKEAQAAVEVLLDKMRGSEQTAILFTHSLNGG